MCVFDAYYAFSYSPFCTSVFVYLCIFVFVQCSAVVWLVVCPHQGRFRQQLGTGFKPSPAPVVRWHDDDNDQQDGEDDDQDDDDEDDGYEDQDDDEDDDHGQGLDGDEERAYILVV